MDPASQSVPFVDQPPTVSDGAGPSDVGASGKAIFMARRASKKMAMIPRIKEVFSRFDTSGDHMLDDHELRKVLKALLGKVSYHELDRYCEDIRGSGESQTSQKQLLQWVLNGSASETIADAIKAETGEKRSLRIRETFDRYDASGDGNLDICELKEVLHSLGAFTNNEVVIVCTDLDVNKDGAVSFDEFETWLKCGAHDRRGSARSREVDHVMTKAKAILAPADTDGLESVFYCWCTAGRSDMDLSIFIKICKSAGVIDKLFTTIALELIFNHTSVKPKGDKFIDFCQFEVALEMIAEKKGVSREEVTEKFLDLVNPVLKGTKADYVRFHDDKSTYTGAHRFDHSLLPGGGTADRKTLLLTPRPASRSEETPTKPLSRESNSKSLSESGRSLKLKFKAVELSSMCTSLDAPVADNRELHKVFGQNTKAGRLLKVLYAKNEVIYPSNGRTISPTNAVAASSPGNPRRAISLPAIRNQAAVDHGDSLMWPSPRSATKSWKSPFIQYLAARPRSIPSPPAGPPFT